MKISGRAPVFPGVLDEAGRPLAVGARTHPEAARPHFAGYTDPLPGVLRQAGIEAHAITDVLRRQTARAPLLAARVGDRCREWCAEPRRVVRAR
ncbi:hypothetical protein ACFYP4_08515 [Streptomyces sp. NPDC005551]|uniref:hypothetical protein n=1 Tax=Streptomyces sp. NPDC005551 TaxID=3364725 RepID=UPI003683E4F6